MNVIEFNNTSLSLIRLSDYYSQQYIRMRTEPQHKQKVEAKKKKLNAQRKHKADEYSEKRSKKVSKTKRKDNRPKNNPQSQNVSKMNIEKPAAQWSYLRVCWWLAQSAIE